MSEITINIETEVHPTEDPEKVKTAVENLFIISTAEILVKKERNILTVKAKGKQGLTKFHTILRQERIIIAARRILHKGTNRDSILFYVNKQAAYMNRVSFCEPIGESPLVPIRVEIKTDNTEALIDWLTPRIDIVKEE